MIVDENVDVDFSNMSNVEIVNLWQAMPHENVKKFVQVGCYVSNAELKHRISFLYKLYLNHYINRYVDIVFNSSVHDFDLEQTFSRSLLMDMINKVKMDICFYRDVPSIYNYGNRLIFSMKQCVKNYFSVSVQGDLPIQMVKIGKQV